MYFDTKLLCIGLKHNHIDQIVIKIMRSTYFHHHYTKHHISVKAKLILLVR